MHLGVNNIVGADKLSYTRQHGQQDLVAYVHTHSLSLTCKAIPFTYKRGCAPS